MLYVVVGSKDTETGISDFQLTVYAECKDGTFYQIYTATMLTSNSESYEEILQVRTKIPKKH